MNQMKKKCKHFYIKFYLFLSDCPYNPWEVLCPTAGVNSWLLAKIMIYLIKVNH